MVGGLGVALTPALGMMSGGVSPDAMLFAVSAATFYCLARGFRRGLTRRLAIAIGALMAIGFLTKLNYIGLAPGAFLGLVLLSVRARRGEEPDAYRSLALALGVAVSPLCLYVLANLLSGHPAFGIVSAAFHYTSSAGGSIFDGLGYVWQFYLPRLPGMTSYFPGIATTHAVWFDRSVGLYGWLDTSFPPWAESVALVASVPIALLCARGLFAARASVRRHVGELAVYAAMGVGTLALVAADSWAARNDGASGYFEPRYLLPLLPLLAAALVLAARGAGRRWGASAGAAIVALFLAHDVFSQLLVVARFYG